MKKVLLGLLFFVAVATQGQTYTIANPLRLGTVNQGTASDSVLVRGVDKIIKYVPRSSFGGGGSQDLQSVLDSGGYAFKGLSGVSLLQPNEVGGYDTYITSGTPGGLENSSLTVDSFSASIKNFFGNKEAIVETTNGKILLSQRDAAGNETKVDFADPISRSAIKFPAKPVGNYTLATIDDIPSITTTAPTSSTATGTKGEIRVVAGYIYWCTAPNTWIRAAGTTF